MRRLLMVLVLLCVCGGCGVQGSVPARSITPLRFCERYNQVKQHNRQKLRLEAFHVQSTEHVTFTITLDDTILLVLECRPDTQTLTSVSLTALPEVPAPTALQHMSWIVAAWSNSEAQKTFTDWVREILNQEEPPQGVHQMQTQELTYSFVVNSAGFFLRLHLPETKIINYKL